MFLSSNDIDWQKTPRSFHLRLQFCWRYSDLQWCRLRATNGWSHTTQHYTKIKRTSAVCLSVSKTTGNTGDSGSCFWCDVCCYALWWCQSDLLRLQQRSECSRASRFATSCFCVSQDRTKQDKTTSPRSWPSSSTLCFQHSTFTLTQTRHGRQVLHTFTFHCCWSTTWSLRASSSVSRHCWKCRDLRVSAVQERERPHEGQGKNHGHFLHQQTSRSAA